MFQICDEKHVSNISVHADSKDENARKRSVSSLNSVFKNISKYTQTQRFSEFQWSQLEETP